ncbi:MAG: hypothetical protein mread185_000565 [Mycoplasmataceae bacterium]|nr:MAG: hypothetical protein mread185_000565 [Mycoplasmataceae bacterium]
MALRHLAILRLYNLYRLFDPQKLICIRGDEIYVQGDLPSEFNQDLFHCRLLNKFTVHGNSFYNHDLQELKSFAQGQEREKLIEWFKNQ